MNTYFAASGLICLHSNSLVSVSDKGLVQTILIIETLKLGALFNKGNLPDSSTVKNVNGETEFALGK